MSRGGRRGDIRRADNAAGVLTFPQLPPLPASAVEYWHGELGASAATAVGQIAGTVLTGRNTPAVAADPGFFKGRPVYTCTTVGSKCWLGSSLATVLAAGSRPYVYVIGRWRAVPGGANQRISGIGRTGSSDDGDIEVTAANVRQITSSSGAFTAINGVGDTAVHRLSAFTTGATTTLSVDGAGATGGGGAALPGNITGVSIGSNSGGVGNVGDVCVAFDLLCSAMPTAPEIAALDAWAIGYWGSN